MSRSECHFLLQLLLIAAVLVTAATSASIQSAISTDEEMRAKQPANPRFARHFESAKMDIFVKNPLNGIGVVSGNGLTLLVGQPRANNFSGGVREYSRNLDNGQWTPRGFISGQPSFERGGDPDLDDYVFTPDEQPGSRQGSSVAVSDNGMFMVLGGYQDDFGHGAVWFMKRMKKEGFKWEQMEQKFTGASSDLGFGFDVQMSGDGRVAAVYELVSAILYIFERPNATTWVPTATINLSSLGEPSTPNANLAVNKEGDVLVYCGTLGASIYEKTAGVWEEKVHDDIMGRLGVTIFTGPRATLVALGSGAVLSEIPDNSMVIYEKATGHSTWSKKWVLVNPANAYTFPKFINSKEVVTSSAFNYATYEFFRTVSAKINSVHWEEIPIKKSLPKTLTEKDFHRTAAFVDFAYTNWDEHSEPHFRVVEFL